MMGWVLFAAFVVILVVLVVYISKVIVHKHKGRKKVIHKSDFT